ncbi:unnamed protein product, partial [Urochloa humidicola]
REKQLTRGSSSRWWQPGRLRGSSQAGSGHKEGGTNLHGKQRWRVLLKEGNRNELNEWSERMTTWLKDFLEKIRERPTREDFM